MKAKKMVELMMVSGVPTSSGFEERIRFSELEIVDANAIETGVLSSMPEGNYLNGWDVNIAGVRITTARRNIRQHKHAVGFLWLAWVHFRVVHRVLMRVKNRNSCFESSARAGWSSTLAGDTGTLPSCTRT